MSEEIDYGQRILDAVAREKSLRDAAWLDLPARICGMEFRQMTVRHYLVLDGVDSPFVRGGIPTPEQLAQFLWIVSPSFTPDEGEALRFTKEIGKLPFTQAVQESLAYVEQTFLDAPQGAKRDDGSPDYFSWLSSIVDALGSEYGWKPFEIMEMPLRQVFQLLRVIRRRHDPKAVLFNNLSDRAKLDWVQSMKKKAA